MADVLKVAVHESVESISAFVPEWDALLEKVPGATTFSTWEWLGAWWRSFGNGHLFIVALYDSSDLVGLAPLYITNKTAGSTLNLNILRFLGDGSGDSDNLEVIARPGYEDSVALTLIEFLKQSPGKWQLVDFSTMPAESAVGKRFSRYLNSQDWMTYERMKPASFVPLPETWPAYFQTLSSEDRNNLIRYRKRLEKRYYARFYRAVTESEVKHCLATMYRLHQRRWQLRGEKGTFAETQRRRFYADISPLFLKRGWLELWALDLDGRTVAVQFAFRYRDQVFQLQEGFDPEYSSDRVGTLLRAHVLEQLIARGIRCYDFLGGEPGYKARWRAVTNHYTFLQFARSRSLGGLYLFMLKKARNGKEMLRNKLPKSAWNILHHVNVGLMGRNTTKA
jgi:CelD/BcsL family acetyltransferase involved in cellulose biosynthesis